MTYPLGGFLVPDMPTPRLPYPTDGLDPVIDDREVRAHFELNHMGYYKKAKSLLRKQEGPGLSDRESADLVFNMDGNALHQLWWDNLKPVTVKGPKKPSREILDAFGGNARALKKEILEVGSSVQGSGWVALSVIPSAGEAWVHPVRNHEYDWVNRRPLLLIDVWEHAYLPAWWGAREAYLAEVYDRLVNWAVVAKRLDQALRG